MGSDEKYIELRIGYRSRPSYVARLGGRCPVYRFQREFNLFRVRREILPDGSRQEIHLLPDADETYEVKGIQDGKRMRWYIATLQGDPNIYRIGRFGVEMVSKKRMSIREVIREYPEMPPIEVEE